MSAALLAIDIIVTFIIVVLVLREYGNLRKSYLVTIPVLTAWFFSWSIMLILPLDVSATWFLDCSRDFYCGIVASRNESVAWCNDIEYNQTAEFVAVGACQASPSCTCSQPISYISQSTLPMYWEVVYWSSQVLMWLVLPMIESYMAAGDFSVWHKFISAVKENLLINSVFAVLGSALLIYIAVANHLDMAGLKAVVIAMSNSSGLFFVVVFLGYGIVDVPRSYFRLYSRARTLKTLQFRAGTLNGELHDAEERVDGLITKLKDMRGTIPPDDELRPYLNKVRGCAGCAHTAQILEKCPSLSNLDDYNDYTKESDAMPTLSTLAKLNKKLMKAQRIEARCRAQWNALLDEALELEEVIDNARKTTHVFTSQFSTPYKGPLAEYVPSLKWYWKIWIEPVCYLLIGTVSTLFSLAVLWSEVTFSTFLSVYAQIITQAGRAHKHLLLEAMTFITLCYMCLCTYRVVFKLRLFNFYYLVRKQQSDSSSLLYSGMALCRLTVPLSLNFLGMAHLDNHVTSGNSIGVETSFTVVMGHMDVLSFMNNFSLYYPIVIVPVCLGTLFNIQHRVLAAIGVHSAFVDSSGHEEFVEEGKALISMERNRRLRGDLSGPVRGQARPATEGVRDEESQAPARKIKRSSSSKTVSKLQDYLANLRDKKPGAAKPATKPASKSRFSWGTSDSDRSDVDVHDFIRTDARSEARADARKGSAAVSNPLGTLRKMFGGEHEEDEVELLPPRISIPPPARSSRPPKNFFDS